MLLFQRVELADGGWLGWSIASISLVLVLLKVGAQTETELKEKKLRVEDALNATKVGVQHGPPHIPHHIHTNTSSALTTQSLVLLFWCCDTTADCAVSWPPRPRWRRASWSAADAPCCASLSTLTASR